MDRVVAPAPSSKESWYRVSCFGTVVETASIVEPTGVLRWEQVCTRMARWVTGATITGVPSVNSGAYCYNTIFLNEAEWEEQYQFWFEAPRM